MASVSRRELFARLAGLVLAVPLTHLAHKGKVIKNTETLEDISGIKLARHRGLREQLEELSFQESCSKGLMPALTLSTVVGGMVRNHQTQKEIQELRDQALEDRRDPADNLLEQWEVNRRDAGCVALGAFITSILAALMGERIHRNQKPLERYLEKNPLANDPKTRACQVLCAMGEQNEDSMQAGMGAGFAAGALQSLGYMALDRAADLAFEEYDYLFRKARNELQDTGETDLPGWSAIRSKKKPPLICFFPKNYLNESLQVTLTNDDLGSIKAAYFSEEDGEEQNWSGPGIYEVDLQRKRKTNIEQLHMPKEKFSIVIDKVNGF